MKDRLAPFLGGMGIALLALTVMSRAFAVTTVPNASKTSFSVPAGATSGYVRIAAVGQPVQVMIAKLNGNPPGVVNLTFLFTSAAADRMFVSGNDAQSSFTSNPVALPTTSDNWFGVLDQMGKAKLNAHLLSGTPTINVQNTEATSINVVVLQVW